MAEPDFTPIETGTKFSDKAKQEADQLERTPVDYPANSVTFNLGKFCHIRWHADSSVPLFCFLEIILLLAFGLLLAIISVTNSAVTWPSDVFKSLCQALLTLVGAVIGSSVTSGMRAKRPPKN